MLMAEMEQITEDGVKARTIIEVLGKPKEHVETAIRGYIDKIKKDRGLEIKIDMIALLDEEARILADRFSPPDEFYLGN